MQKLLTELSFGERVDHLLFIKRLESKKTKAGKEFLDLDLSDQSCSLNAKYWSGFEEFKKFGSKGMIARFTGVIDDYMGTKQIKIEKTFPVDDEDGVSVEDFLPKSKRDLKVMTGELKSRIDKIGNSYLKRLLNLILTGKRFDKYIRVPAGKSWHHSYVHGLLEHTLEIVKICDLMCDIHHDVNRDLLISGAILHDFGKTEELSSDGSFDYTSKGRLLGHIVIAAIEIEKAAKKIEWFPDDLKDQLLHLVLSHQGKLEFATPVEPKTVEAIILYHADELSAKTNAYKNAIASDSTEGSWTKYLPLAGTQLFKEKIESEEEKDNHSLFDK